jgi:NAD(P)-dependent dehydrogenase (short-subunit alcohol dehydrogenase family)
MVPSLKAIEFSNQSLRDVFPTTSLVAVFIGATAGIGEYTITKLAKSAPGSRLYFVGRSEEDGVRVKAACDEANKPGSCTFIKKDVSLMKNVDEVCKEIREKEKSINLLFMTQGTIDLSSGKLFVVHFGYSDANHKRIVTSEGLPLALALMLYSRTRFILSLLPQLNAASQTSFARVVSVATGTHESHIDLNDLDMAKTSAWNPLYIRGMAASMITLALSHIQQQNERISFIHSHPGPVYSKIDRTMTGWLAPLKWLIRFLMLFHSMTAAEAGVRHVFLATSAQWPAAMSTSEGVSWCGDSGDIVKDFKVVNGIDGEQGSGVYSVDAYGESAGDKVVKLLKGYVEDGTRDKLWKHVEDKYVSITGSVSIP